MKLPSDYQSALDRASDALQRRLGENLISLALYGSAVRGMLVPGVSDLNLLIVLAESTPDAHAAVGDALQGRIRITPFIVGRKGLERSMGVFAGKFRSIRRNYKVLHGEDPFEKIEISEKTARFICEQALRNLRLRAVRAFVRFGGQPKAYREYLLHAEPNIFTNLSEIVRLAGTEIPHDFADRVPILEKHLGADVSVLRDLLSFKEKPRRLSADEIRGFHARLFGLLDHAVRWVEEKWPALEQPK
jgi:hypothetical protein